MELGTCYYPEHWPEARWATDAAMMAEMGLSHIRIAEFAWSRIEPSREDWQWEWLDRAVETLGGAGLKIIMCTPTATPPKWLIDERPGILAVGADGRVREFGSRRHYDFSSPEYREESARITAAITERYGENPHVAAWQTDNEYDCHDTVRSWSPHARDAFRYWLANKYATIDALNTAWGGVFWSMEFTEFHQIDLANLTVTEANPSQRLDFARFCSDQVMAFNLAQTAIIRANSPGRWITHNVMGVSTGFDHYELGAQIEMTSWDSYPLGFLEQSAKSRDFKTAYQRQGDPDFAAFHHDLYRNCSDRWGVMEQQNGPVNWAPHNPAPMDGMVALWAVEAWAHGADLMSWFRWRQVPFAQEQNHAGLLNVDGSLAQGGREATRIAKQLAEWGEAGEPVREVALVFDYAAKWMFDIQPQGAGWDYERLVGLYYEALRELGLNVDIVSPRADLNAFAMVVIPSLPVMARDLVDRLAAFDGPVVIGPRTGSKTADFHIPTDLPPGPLRAQLPLCVERGESLGDGRVWRDLVRDVGAVEVLSRFGDDWPAHIRSGTLHYLTGWPGGDLVDVLEDIARLAELPVTRIAAGRRLRKTTRWRVVTDYVNAEVDVSPVADAPPRSKSSTVRSTKRSRASSDDPSNII